jgi:hypothetical protein
MTLNPGGRVVDVSGGDVTGCHKLKTFNVLPNTFCKILEILEKVVLYPSFRDLQRYCESKP